MELFMSSRFHSGSSDIDIDMFPKMIGWNGDGDFLKENSFQAYWNTLASTASDLYLEIQDT